jgi:SOS-response transcriptional repressor LexA
MGPVLVTTREGQYSVLQAALPGRSLDNIGVLLLNPSSDRLQLRLRRRFEEIAGPDDCEVLELLEEDLEAKASEMGGEALLRYLEDTLSSTLRITDREAVQIQHTFGYTLERLYSRHVEAVKVLPFVAHLPLYSLRAAAGKFGEDMEVQEEDWVPAPQRLSLTPDMFVAHVVGRSMEPRIPDGSLCAFGGNVVGSRQGKLLLVEVFGTTDTSARYTVKRYRSRKVAVDDEGQWRHESIRLEPLNPEFEAFELGEGDFRVIGEFLQVLE